ncbi:hypothetical protein [Bythopirellula polymerisocia]|uniref:GP-PDE domain-containing protein n=1 Tax=Bythopirellula polymerisocia TaxID=2528003 RepID=A0A5C6CRK2_9BACT|nr:hypothetical protein [Bythopirellula polymerisocia]TWU26081.1 hypothetical protein Pla144_32980 [Bythopirellula polymerisocia]
MDTIPPEKKFFIEIKCGPEIVPHLKCVLLDSSVPLENLKIISFDEEVIRVAKQDLPEIEAFWIVRFKEVKNQNRLTPEVDEIIAIASRIGADGLDLQARTEVLDAGFVMRCRYAGFGLHTWVVDDPALAKQLGGLGFESITTNRPGFLRKSLSAQEGTVPVTSESLPLRNNPSISLENASTR